MQKKICLILFGYILLLAIIGVSLAIKNGLSKLPVLEEVLIQDILRDEQGGNTGSGQKGGNISGSPGEIDLPENTGDPNYWEKYNANAQGKQGNAGSPQAKSIDISVGDKVRVMHILKKNLTVEDIRLLVSLAQGGLNQEEKEEVKALLQRKLEQSDKEELKSIVYKYI